MSRAATLSYPQTGETTKRGLYVRVVILLFSAVTICATLIIRYTDWTAGTFMADFSTQLDIGISTLLPYMISAVVAAITAVAIIALLPTAGAIDPTERIVERLRELNAGNLSSRIKLQADGNLRGIAYELNRAVGTLNSQVSTLKVVNRQQWQTLCDIRGAVERNELKLAIEYIEEMERNWEKVAEIESRLLT
jgi:methyl-accepting chemotaxis protein